MVWEIFNQLLIVLTLKIRADVVKDSSKLKNYSSFILPGVELFHPQ